ncbi:hypothetical protein DAETH_30720 [Deinococcus aetherius]|uniref:DUF2382 domain-containing protein n=1 Tax=Deinococcus aetherius TaxID=200252 RepID=A0ABM8AHE3_9DEIO|nr:DUF2382 domain-containing protein [Deinococcus aetherius]BDP43103.1 hypothetical protein DAETH_30720 [Deinococcus aetherius]
MPHLHRLSDISNSYREDFQDAGMYNPVGATAYAGSRQIGTVRDVLVDDDYGKIRYLLVDDDNGSLNGALIVPIGYARIENDGVYFDSMNEGQLSSLHRYDENEEYTFDLEESDERVLRGANTAMGTSTTSTTTTMSGSTMGDAAMSTAATGAMSTGTASASYDREARERMFRTPERLQLLEERLSVNKEKYRAGSVQIGKRVETHQETVSVPVQREEVIIERHPVSNPQPVQGDVLSSSGSETVRVDLEAERAEVSKQAFVAEEVEVGKRVVTEQQTVTDTVGREVLEVNQTGDVRVTGDEDDLRNNRS